MEFGNALPYKIVITGSSNKGFIVKTGCCTCVFTDKEEMLDAIQEYIDDPKKMEIAYNELNQNPTQAEGCDIGGVCCESPAPVAMGRPSR